VSGVYLYALLGATPVTGPGVGVGGEPLRLVEVGGLVALVGDLSEALTPSPATLSAQDALLRRLTAGVDAVLPARFGTLVADDAALMDALAPRRSELAQALAQVAGCEQMTLRVWGERAAPASDGDAPGTGPGARYLAARRRARQVPEVDALRARLGDLVRAERAERHDRPPLLATVQHLVLRGESARYLAAVELVGACLAPWRVTVTGPWLPYAFGEAA
jgi:Gas vesicle synthesis protein GvpL/GvpF